MKNQEQFVRSVDILVDAYEKGNLEHLSPCNCAVGNLIAYNTGTYEIGNLTGENRHTGAWAGIVDKIREKRIECVSKENLESTILDRSKFENCSVKAQEIYERQVDHFKFGFIQIEKTGYSANEIERIEAAFEKNEIPEGSKIALTLRLSEDHDDPLEGLLKAVSVLGDIHEIPEEALSCVKEKIQDKTYVKSFTFETPKQ